ncbi:MAG: SpoIIIAH-like family protein [Eubacteriaceae bacterium]|nr:SpoIIIAH-like family protein [Eubacteriaceae bacterium]
MSILQKKNLILGVLVVMLVATSYINYRMYVNTPNEVAETDNPNNLRLVTEMTTLEEVVAGQQKVNSAFFSEYRLERDAVRSENITLLESIVNNKNATKEAVAEATDQMIKLVQNREAIRSIEGQIKSKGFDDAVVFIESGYATVFIDANDISQQQAIQIQEVVHKETGIEISNIAIGCSGK